MGNYHVEYLGFSALGRRVGWEVVEKKMQTLPPFPLTTGKKRACAWLLPVALCRLRRLRRGGHREPGDTN